MSTIAKMIASGDSLRAHCWTPDCPGQRGRKIDLHELAARIGMDAKLVGRTWRCVQCGKVGGVTMSSGRAPKIIGPFAP